MMQKHNTNTKLKVGDQVLVKDMKNERGEGGNLNCLFPGPYTIDEVLGKGRFHLKGEYGNVRKISITMARSRWRETEATNKGIATCTCNY